MVNYNSTWDKLLYALKGIDKIIYQWLIDQYKITFLVKEIT